MWVYTKNGFFSVVAVKDSHMMLQARARMRKHLIHLSAFTGKRILHTDDGDYPYRVILSRLQMSDFMSAHIINDIDYPNFKDAVRDKRYSSVLANVWARTLHLDPHGRIHPYLRALTG